MYLLSVDVEEATFWDTYKAYIIGLIVALLAVIAGVVIAMKKRKNN